MELYDVIRGHGYQIRRPLDLINPKPLTVALKTAFSVSPSTTAASFGLDLMFSDASRKHFLILTGFWGISWYDYDEFGVY